MQKLKGIEETAKKKSIKIILVQIEEAHSSAWKLPINALFGEKDVESQKNMKERIQRANYFADKYQLSYEIYIDSWENEFSNLFRAWPDKYHLIDENLCVIKKSEYGTEGINDARIKEDYIDIINLL